MAQAPAAAADDEVDDGGGAEDHDDANDDCAGAPHVQVAEHPGDAGDDDGDHRQAADHVAVQDPDDVGDQGSDAAPGAGGGLEPGGGAGDEARRQPRQDSGFRGSAGRHAKSWAKSFEIERVATKPAGRPRRRRPRPRGALVGAGGLGDRSGGPEGPGHDADIAVADPARVIAGVVDGGAPRAQSGLDRRPGCAGRAIGAPQHRRRRRQPGRGRRRSTP